MKWILPISFLVIFELVADVLAKEWTLHKGSAGYIFAGCALVAYLIGNSFWLFALKDGSGLARGSVIFSVASGIAAIIIGLVFFKENVTRIEMIGLILGLISVTLILWNE